jgi:hypothetical protein
MRERQGPGSDGQGPRLDRARGPYDPPQDNAYRIACATVLIGFLIAVILVIAFFFFVHRVFFVHRAGGPTHPGGTTGRVTAKPGAQPCTPASPQAEYQCAIIMDRSALTRGTAMLQQSISIPLGQTYEFEVTICGDQALACALAAEPVPSPLPAAAPVANAGAGRQLWVGASMSVVLTGNMPGQITSQAATVQPVISESDAASWSWELDPSQAGTFQLTLSVTPLLANTDTPLEAAIPYPIRLKVTETTGQQLTHAVSSGSSLIERLAEVLGAAGITIAGIATWTWQRVRKRRAKQAEPQAGNPAAPEAAPAIDPATELAAENATARPSGGTVPSRADGSKASDSLTAAGVAAWLWQRVRKRRAPDTDPGTGSAAENAAVRPSDDA